MNDLNFELTDRSGKTALWAVFGTERWNLWDLPSELINEDILKAIQFSFHRGWEMALAETQRNLYGLNLNRSNWEDKRCSNNKQ